MPITPVRRPQKERRKSKRFPRRRIIDSKAQSKPDDKTKTKHSKSKQILKTTNESKHEESLSTSRYELRSLSKSSPQNKKDLTTVGSLYQNASAARIGDARPRNLRNTVYRTPKIKSSIKDYVPLKKDKSQWKSDVQNLLNKTWKVSYLSTMTHFNYKKPNFRKQYESTLKLKILDVYPSYKLTVTLDTSSCLSQNINKVDAITLTVVSLMPGEDPEDDKDVEVYNAWLFKTNKIQSKALQWTEWFPMMIYSGTETIHRAFITWLQASFGCYVAPKGFPSYSLMWIAAKWSLEKCQTKGHNIDNSEISFQYQICPSLSHITFEPPNDKGRASVILRYLASDIKNVWMRIQNEQKLLDEKQMFSFHSTMGYLAKGILCIPTSLLHLNVIRTPCISMARDGRIKLLCPRKFAALLDSLMEIFLDSCHFNNLEELDDEEITQRDEDLP